MTSEAGVERERERERESSNLVFYAQSTSVVISGRERESKNITQEFSL